MTHINDSAAHANVHGKQYSNEYRHPQNSAYPNSLTVLSVVTTPDDSQLGPQFCGFTMLHAVKTELLDGLSFKLSGEGGIGVAPSHQAELCKLFLQKLRPDHVLVLIGCDETIANLNECARAHPDQGIEAIVEVLNDKQKRGEILDLARLINRPGMTIDDALRLTGNTIPLDRQREIDAWFAESEDGLLTFYRQRNYVILFLLQALTLPPGEQYVGLLAIWQHQHNSSLKY